MGTHLRKIWYSFVDRNVPDWENGDTPSKEWGQTSLLSLALGVGGMSPIGMAGKRSKVVDR